MARLWFRRYPGEEASRGGRASCGRSWSWDVRCSAALGRLGEVSVRRVLAPSLAVVWALAAATPAWAEDDTPLLSFSLGYYDQTIVNPGFLFLRVSPYKSEHKEAVDFRGEYRFGTSLLPGSSPGPS